MTLTIKNVPTFLQNAYQVYLITQKNLDILEWQLDLQKAKI